MVKFCICTAVLILINAPDPASSISEPCKYHDTISFEDENYILSDHGTITHNNITYPQNMWGTYNYKLINGTKVYGNIHRRGCFCLLKQCIRFCCPMCLVFKKHVGCVSTSLNFTVLTEVFDDNTNENVDLAKHEAYKNRLLFNHDHCLHTYSEDQFEDETNKLYKNGSVLSIIDDTARWISHNEYCLEVRSDGKTLTTLKRFCIVPNENHATTKRINAIVMYLSVPFLLSTFLVYAFVPKLRNTHGKSIMFYVAGLGLGYLSMAINLSSDSWDSLHCKVFGYSSYFGFMLSFFWLNVMCIDIWLAFSNYLMQLGEIRKFRYYLGYACGMPSLFMGALFVLDSLEIERYGSRIGIEHCTFANGRAKIIFMYVPMGFLIICNLVLYLLTMLKMQQLRRETAILRKGTNKCHIEYKSRLALNFRLLIIMGLTWTLEVLTWLIKNHPSLKVVTWICDACNGLQGVFIFFLFIMRKRVAKLISERCKAIQNKEQPKSTRLSFNKNRDSSSINFSDICEFSPPVKTCPSGQA